ncbi:hypothetical protein V8C86DRAFT_2598176 [Haematococcus lacustris]
MLRAYVFTRRATAAPAAQCGCWGAAEAASTTCFAAGSQAACGAGSMSPQGPALCIEQLGRRTKAATARAPHRTPTERLRCRISHASLAVEASVSNHDDHEAASSPMQVSSYQQELLGKMSKFMGPATLIPLGDPLMSLCDTVCIGQYAGTSELAALGPATMIFSFCQYFFQNLQVASLSVISSRLREGAQGAAARTLACALLLAAVAGTLTAAGLEAGAPWLLQAVGVKDAALLPMAADYMRVRALAQPAVLVTMVAQSGLLAQHDSLTPCISVLLAAAVSLAGNVVFVAGQGWGLTGAAVTTVATQYVAAGALMWSLQRSSSQLRPAWGLPRGSELWALLHTMAPLTVVSLSKHLCYLVVQSTATGLHLLSLAAHQAAFTVWTLVTWTISPIEQACLAYLPGARHLWQRKAAGQMIIAMGAGVACLAGALLALLLTWCPGFLTPDSAVHRQMALIALPAALSACLVGLDVSSTAINITQRDFTYMARSYVVTLLATSLYFWACRSQGWGLLGVWWGLVLFFAMRSLQSMVRAWWHLHLPRSSGHDLPTNSPAKMTAADLQDWQAQDKAEAALVNGECVDHKANSAQPQKEPLTLDETRPGAGKTAPAVEGDEGIAPTTLESEQQDAQTVLSSTSHLM